MNALMFTSHQHDPKWILPSNGQMQRCLFYKAKHSFFDFFSVVFNLFEFWPVMGVALEIVPCHFIDTYSEDGFEVRIDALVYQTGDIELVYEKGSGVSVVKNHRMAGRFTFDVECFRS